MSDVSERINLQQFCSTDDYRPHLCTPFCYGVWTYATNGYILVRVPAVDGDPLPQEKTPNEQKLKDILSVHDLPEIGFYPLRVRLPPQTFRNCETCGGTGIIDDGIYAGPCDDCEGTGNFEVQTSVSIKGVFFNAKYVAQISALPNAEFATNPFNSEDWSNLQPSPFRFKGGIGALMLMTGDGELALGDIGAFEI